MKHIKTFEIDKPTTKMYTDLQFICDSYCKDISISQCCMGFIHGVDK